MIRIGLVTFHRAINYGAVLQTYALQKAFTERGADCRVIDYRSKSIEDPYKPFLIRKAGFVSMMKQCVKALKNYKIKKSKKIKVEQFINDYIKLSDLSVTDVEKLNSSFDVFVTGSDQVFNTAITGKDANVYYLSFAKKPRYSYAASFGKKYIADKDISWVSSELKQFSAISVREDSGVEIVQNLIGKVPEVNLDPTLLQDAEEWRSIESKPAKAEKSYILVYNMLSSELLYKAAEQISNKTGLNVIFINSKSRKLREQYPRFSYRDDLSPQEFVWLIDHARYVLCSSFHGTVFSLLFFKPFLTILPKDEPRNARIESLLRLVGLTDRLITESIDISLINKPIDWNEVDDRVKEQRKDSLDYIDNIIVNHTIITSPFV